MTALLWLPCVLSRTVEPGDGTLSVDFGTAASDASMDAGFAHAYPAIIVGADGELELEAEDSNLRVDTERGVAELEQPLEQRPMKQFVPAAKPQPHAGIVHDVHAGIAHRVHRSHDEEGHMRTGHSHGAKRRAVHHIMSGVPLARGFLGMGVSSVVMITGFLIAQYIMNMARCAPSLDQEMENKAELPGDASPASRVAALLPCQCSRRPPPPVRTVAAFAKAELRGKSTKKRKGKDIPADHSESSMMSTEAGYDVDRRKYKLAPVEEKEPEPEHEEEAESELGPKLEGATSYVLRVVKARVDGLSAEKKLSLAWTINSEGQDPPRPSRFTKDMVWDAPVDKIDLDISDPKVPISVAVLAAADNPIEPPSPLAWATVTASTLLAEGSGNRPKVKLMKKEKKGTPTHTQEIPLEPEGSLTLEYSIIAFFHWVVP